MHSPHPEAVEWQAAADAICAIYNQSSPIAFAIVAASILEDQVSRTLEKIAPGGDRVIASHVRRVEFLRAAGIIAPHIADALKHYATIRNEFAHRPSETSYDDAKVQAHAAQLRGALDKEGGDFWSSKFHPFHTLIGGKFTDAGLSNPGSHQVAQILVEGCLLLTFYLIWSRHWAPGPSTPRSINEISAQPTTQSAR